MRGCVVHRFWRQFVASNRRRSFSTEIPTHVCGNALLDGAGSDGTNYRIRLQSRHLEFWLVNKTRAFRVIIEIS